MNLVIAVLKFDGLWGDWGSEDVCPMDKDFVTSFQLKADPHLGSGDDTAMNAIDLRSVNPPHR